MNLLGKFKQTIINAVNPQSKHIKNAFNEAFYWGLGGVYTEYDPYGTTYIDDGYNVNPIVYSIINQMSTKTATIPFYVKKVEDEQMRKAMVTLKDSTGYQMTMQQKVRYLLLENKAFDGESMGMPLEQPNINQSWKEFMALYKTFLRTTGNVYIYMVTVEDGKDAGTPLAVYLLPSQNMQIVIKDNVDLMSIEDPVDHYILTEGNQYAEFPACDVIHIKFSNPNYGVNGEHLYGQSPLRAALRNIENSNAGLDLNIKTLKSGGAFGFIHGKQTGITVTQAKEFKERLLEMNASPDDLSKIAAVSADMGFTRISLTSDELRPFDYLNFDQKMIANVLGWSDKLLNNDAGAKYDNVNEFRKQVVTDNIVPDLDLFTEAMNKHFLPRFKGYDRSVIYFDVMELPEMQDDAKELSAWLYNGLDKGVFNRNEVRKALNWVESEDSNMDRFTVQNDVISLEESLDNDDLTNL